jgi:hypothetical protein
MVDFRGQALGEQIYQLVGAIFGVSRIARVRPSLSSSFLSAHWRARTRSTGLINTCASDARFTVCRTRARPCPSHPSLRSDSHIQKKVSRSVNTDRLTQLNTTRTLQLLKENAAHSLHARIAT